MPTRSHQLIVLHVYKALEHVVTARHLGEVHVAPLPVRLSPGKYPEPDIVFLRTERLQGQPEYPEGADRVIEVVSGGAEDRKRDLVIKRAEYAAAGMPAYWIVDPQRRRITVLVLAEGTYREHGVHAAGGRARSSILPDFSLDVDGVLRAGARQAG